MSLIPDSEPTYFWERYKDLPMLRLPSYQFPIHDGDTALIDQLIDDIIDAHPAVLEVPPPDRIYQHVKTVTGFDPDQCWDLPFPGTLRELRRWWHAQR